MNEDLPDFYSRNDLPTNAISDDLQRQLEYLTQLGYYYMGRENAISTHALFRSDLAPSQPLSDLPALDFEAKCFIYAIEYKMYNDPAHPPLPQTQASYHNLRNLELRCAAQIASLWQREAKKFHF